MLDYCATSSKGPASPAAASQQQHWPVGRPAPATRLPGLQRSACCSRHPTLKTCSARGAPQVQGVVPVVDVHLLRQQAVGLYHDQRIAGLHAEQEVVVVRVAADVGKLEGRLHHAPECTLHLISLSACNGLSECSPPLMALVNTCAHTLAVIRHMNLDTVLHCCGVQHSRVCRSLAGHSQSASKTAPAMHVYTWLTSHCSRTRLRLQSLIQQAWLDKLTAECPRSRTGYAPTGSRGWCRCAWPAPGTCTSPPGV